MVGIAEIAEKAGVSMSTVSNVLNNRKNVGQKTREKVLKIADELNYIHKGPNTETRRKTIIVNFSDFDTLFYLDILRGINDYASARGYHILVCTANDLIHYAKHDSICGVIVIDSHTDDSTIITVANNHIPVITLDRELPHQMIKSILVSNYEGEKQLMEKLIQKGYEKFAFLNGHSTTDAKERYRAFRDVLKEKNIPFSRNDLYEGDWHEQSGAQAARLIMLQERMPEVLVCANDMMAIGAIRKFQENGIRVPEDIAVCGFDDIIISRYLGLTTVNVPDYERGFLSSQALINIIDGTGDYETSHIGARVRWRNTAEK